MFSSDSKDSKLSVYLKDKEITVINLSAIVPWKTCCGFQTASFSAFANLSKSYSKKTSNFSNGLFGLGLNHYAWVLNLDRQYAEELIKPYKQGKIDHTQFFKALLDIFSFLKEAEFPEEAKQSLFERKNHFLTLKNTEARTANELTHEEVALALLEEAWNAPTDFNLEAIDKLTYILTSEEDSIKIIVSNTNSSNANDIWQGIIERFPGIKWDDKLDMTRPITKGDRTYPIRQIAPNIFVCFSHQVGLPKTAGLIALLKDYLDTTKMTLVSQHKPDNIEAENCGIKTQTPSDYFGKIHPTKKLR